MNFRENVLSAIDANSLEMRIEIQKQEGWQGNKYEKGLVRMENYPVQLRLS